VCEYWYKVPHTKDIWLMEIDGQQKVVDSESDEGQALAKLPEFESMVKRRRTVQTHKIMMCIIGGGDSLLEGPVEWAGHMFPFVMIYGEHKVIDGKFKWSGLHRHAKSGQQSYNISRTAIDETIALAPQSKFWATPAQAKGHDTFWAEAHKKNFPFQLYNPDPAAPGAPVHKPGADVPAALIQQSAIAAQDIRDTSGLHEASFGEESGEKSGIALQRKQNQAQIVTYNFPDNIAKGIRRTWEIFVDLIPEIYDAERELRILGSDGAEDYVKVNQMVQGPDGQAIRINDMSVGKYDVTITVGPSFSTMRQEAAEVYGDIATRSPELMQVAGDLIFKAMDLPYSEDIAERWRAILPPQIQQQLSEGKEIPPEAQAVMAQAQQAMQAVQQQTQLVQQAAQEVQQSEAESEKKKSEVQKLISDLEVKRAQFDADIAKQLAALSIKEASIQQRETAIEGQQADADNATTDLSEAKQAVQDIDSMVSEFMDAVAQAMQQIKEQSGMTIAMPKKSRLKGMKATRVNGELVATPEYDGDSDEPRIARIRSSRGADGSMVGIPEYEDAAAVA
jgi:hypothetical protein